MNSQEALLIIEQIVSPKQLNKIQRLIIKYSWDELSYSEIANLIDYDEG